MDLAKMIRERLRAALDAAASTDGHEPRGTNIAFSSNVDSSGRSTSVYSDGEVTIIEHDGDRQVIRHDRRAPGDDTANPSADR